MPANQSALPAGDRLPVAGNRYTTITHYDIITAVFTCISGEFSDGFQCVKVRFWTNKKVVEFCMFHSMATSANVNTQTLASIPTRQLMYNIVSCVKRGKINAIKSVTIKAVTVYTGTSEMSVLGPRCILLQTLVYFLLNICYFRLPFLLFL